ncbi:MAG TPA: hypothetical protein VIM73_21550 [Polyangiaceae bacterium]
MYRFAAALCLAAFVAGCKTDPECERLRMDLAKTWGSLRESAAKRKLAGVDVEGWTKIEERAALLESSFITPQVTWQSAEKARAELGEMVRGRQTDTEANLTGYLLSMEAANKQQAEFGQRCR